MTKYYGKEIIITGEVKFVGDAENPEDDFSFQTWKKAFHEIHSQPERLNEKTYFRNKDGTYPPLEPVTGCDSPNSENK